MTKMRRPSTTTPGNRRTRGTTPNLEQYIETIAHLLTKDKVCTISEIADIAQVTRPAASRAVRELADKNLVVHKAYSYVDLTQRGREVAEQLGRRHEALLRFLRDVLRYDEPTADREACRLEHQTDDEFIRRLEVLNDLIERDTALYDELDSALRDTSR